MRTQQRSRVCKKRFFCVVVKRLFLLQFVDIGIVTSIENNHKPVETARKGMEVCIKIEPIPGESPKMFGRHFDEKDFLVSKVSVWFSNLQLFLNLTI